MRIKILNTETQIRVETQFIHLFIHLSINYNWFWFILITHLKRYSTSKTLFVLRQKSCHKAAFSWSGGYNFRLQHKRLSRCDSFSAVADIAMIRNNCSGWLEERPSVIYDNNGHVSIAAQSRHSSSHLIARSARTVLLRYLSRPDSNSVALFT